MRATVQGCHKEVEGSGVGTSPRRNEEQDHRFPVYRDPLPSRRTGEAAAIDPTADEWVPPPVSVCAIRAMASRMKTKKAVGADKVPAAIVKILATDAPADLARVFSATLAYGKIPPEWKMARLVCLKKPGKTGAHPSDYRPICILQVISKAWGYIVKGRIEEFLGVNGLHPRQFGFRRGGRR